MSFRIREADRAALLSWLEGQFAEDQPVDALAFDRKTGRAQQQIGQLDAQVLATMAPADAIQECLERWCTSAGRWQFRLILQDRDEAGAPVGPARQLRRTVDVRKASAGSESAASGSGAAMEALSTSYGGAFDQLASQVVHQTSRNDHLVEQVLSFQHTESERRLRESTEWAAQVQNLSIELARAEAYIDALEATRDPKIPPEVWAQLVPAAVGLAGALGKRLAGAELPGPEAVAEALEGASEAAEGLAG